MTNFQPTEPKDFFTVLNKRVAQLERNLGGLLKPKLGVIATLSSFTKVGENTLARYGSGLIVVNFGGTVGVATPAGSGLAALTYSPGATVEFAGVGGPFEIDSTGLLTVVNATAAGAFVGGSVSFTASS